MIDAEFTLHDELDSFVVHNSRVSHHVSPIRQDKAERAGSARRADRGGVAAGQTALKGARSGPPPRSASKQDRFR